jgi:hypothetical protein
MSLRRIVSIVGVLWVAVALGGKKGSDALAQITNESPPPGYPPSGCDYDQRGNKYCWGGAGGTATKPTKPVPPAPPVFNGCGHLHCDTVC